MRVPGDFSFSISMCWKYYFHVLLVAILLNEEASFGLENVSAHFVQGLSFQEVVQKVTWPSSMSVVPILPKWGETCASTLLFMHQSYAGRCFSL